MQQRDEYKGPGSYADPEVGGQAPYGEPVRSPFEQSVGGNPASVAPIGVVPVGMPMGMEGPDSVGAFPAAGTVLASTFVVDLGLEIQRGFRRKLLTILLLQLLLTMGVGLTLRYVIPIESLLLVVFPAQSIQALVLGMVCLVCLPLLTYVRDRHPWNLICVALWSVAWGTFLAAAQVPGGMLRSNAGFVIFGAATVGVAFLLLLSTSFTFKDGETGERYLMGFAAAGWISWLLMVGLAVAFYTQTPQLYEQAGHFVGGLLVASALFAWVAYDSAKLCERMQPDDYMKGVVYFYTDFLLVCCCCLLAGCASGGSG